MAKFSVVIPVYNEEQIINDAYKRLKNVMEQEGQEYELVFVNDGSTDSSGEIIKSFCTKDKNIKLLDFSRNFGHQIAISAGLNNANGDAVIIIDADMQDPPEVIPHMIKKWKDGYEVVYGKRTKRKGETWFKKLTAYLFYRLMHFLTSYDIPMDTGDFRLIDKKVCNVLKSLDEKSRYMRGLISWIGFKQTFVEYVREERLGGESHYPFGKMIVFALDAITSFSYRPLRLATYLGFAFSGGAFIYLLYALYQRFFNPATVIGWTSLIAVTVFFNGIILVILGIIGEYIARTYEEAKNRPLYILREKIGFDERF